MNRKILINKRMLIYFILLFIWIPAYSLYSFIPGANKLLLGLRLLSSIVILIKCFGTKMRKEYIILLGFCLVELITTVIHNPENLLNAVEFCMCIMAMCIFFVNLDYNKQQQFRKSTVALTLIYIVGSTIVCYSTPSEIREDLGLHFFISSRANTAQAMVCLLSIIFALDYKIYGKTQKISIVILGLTILDMIGLHSGQGIIMIGIIILTLLVFTKNKSGKLLKILSPAGIGIANVVLNWLIISQAYLKINLLTWFITDVLKKDVTLTGRDIIYTNIVAIYLGSPWLGFGYGNSVVENTLSRFAAGYNSAHNSPFQLLIEVGIIGFAFFFYFVFYILTQLRKAETKQCYVLYGGIIAFLIGGITSLAYYNIYFYIMIMFCIGMYTNDILKIRRD